MLFIKWSTRLLDAVVKAKGRLEIYLDGEKQNSFAETVKFNEDIHRNICNKEMPSKNSYHICLYYSFIMHVSSECTKRKESS